jgi:hypothetical protein
METNIKLVELTSEEKISTAGGLIPYVSEAMAILGGMYAAGFAIGVGLRNYFNP